MSAIKNIIEKIRRSPLLWIYVILIAAGIGFRFAYIYEVSRIDILNLALPKTDMFTYDMLARNLLSAQPIDIKLPHYPGFIIFLSWVYRLFGTTPLALYSVYFVLSMMSVLFLTVTGGLIFGLGSGLIAGLLLLYYKMNFLYDAILMHTALSQFLIITAIFLLVLYGRTKNFFVFTAFAFFGILLSTVRVFFWFIFLPLAWFLLFKDRHYRSSKFIAVHLLLVAAALFAFCQPRRSDQHSHKFGVHFFLGNHAGSNGLFTPIRGIAPHAQGFARDTILQAYQETGSTKNLNTYWIRKTFDSYRGSGRSYFDLLFKKLTYLSNTFEPHNNTSVYYYERKIRLKHYPRVSYSILFALGIMGIWSVFRTRHKGGRVLFIPTVTVALMILTVFFCSRYRMPLIPFLCLYAGYGAGRFWECIEKKNYEHAVVLSLVVIMCFFWSIHPIPLFRPERDADYWQSKEEKKTRYYQSVNDTLSRYENWDKLTDTEKVDLAIRLEKLSRPLEFAAIFDKAHIAATTSGDEAAALRLLHQKAQFYESTFNFLKARRTWEILLEFPSYKNEAQKKIDEINVLGPLLDKDFQE